MNDKKLFKAQTNVGDNIDESIEEARAKAVDGIEAFVELFKFVGFNEGQIGAITTYGTYIGAAANGDLYLMDRITENVRDLLNEAKLGGIQQ